MPPAGKQPNTFARIRRKKIPAIKRIIPGAAELFIPAVAVSATLK
jgi:hypothetical protein